MAEYIERDKTIAEIDDCFPANPTSEFSKGVAVGLAMAKVAVNHTPTADARPVVRGEWIDTDNYYQRWKCSVCGCHTRDARPPFCPNCGADMREGN